MDDTSADLLHPGKYIIDPIVKKGKWASFRTWMLGKPYFFILRFCEESSNLSSPEEMGLSGEQE